MGVLDEIARESVTWDRLTLSQRLRILFWQYTESPEYARFVELWRDGMTAEAAYHNAKN